MADNKYPPGGALFKRDKRGNDRAPDWSGDLELAEDVVRFLVGEIKAGREPKIRIAGWIKQGRKDEFMSIRGEKPYQKDGDRQDSRRDERRDDRRDDRRSRRDDPFDDGDQIPF